MHDHDHKYLKKIYKSLIFNRCFEEKNNFHQMKLYYRLHNFPHNLLRNLKDALKWCIPIYKY